jgi:hypothetical protein
VVSGAVSEAGSVPELLVKNLAPSPVLILDGEELIGAKQNRIVNLAILVAAGQTLRIPVSCVEAGRWVHRSREFAAAGRARHGGVSGESPAAGPGGAARALPGGAQADRRRALPRHRPRPGRADRGPVCGRRRPEAL